MDAINKDIADTLRTLGTLMPSLHQRGEKLVALGNSVESLVEQSIQLRVDAGRAAERHSRSRLYVGAICLAGIALLVIWHIITSEITVSTERISPPPQSIELTTN